MSERHFEDFRIGEVIELGQYPPISEAEMTGFADQWDPGVYNRPLPLDLPSASIASGWYLGAVCMRLLVEGLLQHCAAEGSPGLDNLRFLAEVRAGDVLSGRYTVLEAGVSVRRPGIGKLRVLIELVKETGEAALSMEATQFMRRREHVG